MNNISPVSRIRDLAHNYAATQHSICLLLGYLLQRTLASRNASGRRGEGRLQRPRQHAEQQLKLPACGSKVPQAAVRDDACQVLKEETIHKFHGLCLLRMNPMAQAQENG